MPRAVLLSLVLAVPAVPARADPIIPHHGRVARHVSAGAETDRLRSSGLSARPIVRSRARSTR